jgi:hypothetical protein
MKPPSGCKPKTLNNTKYIHKRARRKKEPKVMPEKNCLHSSYLKLFCFSREFQFKVLEILCTQPSPCPPGGRTLAKGYLDADTVT